ncbi:hypothetical protein [Pseudarthrobacter sulfonivorans]|uniref:hypothetical protein n=1 Tax=Pseudarthrobacter sulfonivorans TaxID=121292 RepID=UPI0021076888|nr:hypothetical protein [Pseudarthrobacter sulfonivorans]
MLNKRLAITLTVSALVAGTAACGAPAQTPPSQSSSSQSSPSQSSPATATGAAGWALAPDAGGARIKAAGLEILNAEGTAEHYHAHLDVFVDGKPITVPADIGFSFGAGGQANGISALHTHDTTGIIHIEAPTSGAKYSLGQVLREWGVLDGSDTSGAPHGGTDGWSAYVNGSKQDGPVTDVVLKAHDEVVLSFGAAPSPLPGTYTFPAGL